MLDDTRLPAGQDADYVEFVSAGTSASGAYQCAECGYGVTLRSLLPVCPMCAGTSWEQVPWSPFGRALARLNG